MFNERNHRISLSVRGVSSLTAVFFILSCLNPLPIHSFSVELAEGDAVISSSNGATTITTSANTVFQGDTSILANEVVQILGSNNVLLRDITGSQTNWLGSLSSQGSVLLVNTHGVYIAQSAAVNVQSLLVSTLNLQNQDFLANNLHFEKMEGLDPGKIVNEAALIAAQGGYLVFLAENIENKGTMTAYLGTVAMATGNKMTMSFDDRGLVNVVVDEGLQNIIQGEQGISQKGNLIAEGGKIQLTAKTVQETMNHLISNEGIIKASRALERDGVVELVSNGAVENTGAINTRLLTESGYSFFTSGAIEGGIAFYDNLDGAANISGSIGSSQYDLVDLVVTGNITLTANNLTFGADLDADGACVTAGSCNGTGAFQMNAGTKIMSQTGNTYNLTIKSSQTGGPTLSQLGGNNGSDGGAGLGILTLTRAYAGSTPTYTANSPDTTTWYANDFRITTANLDKFNGAGTSGDPYLIYDVFGLQAMSGFLSSTFYLNNDVDASGTVNWNTGSGFVPVEIFTGDFNGQDHTITGLTINRGAESTVGLFGVVSSASIQKVGLTNVAITGASYVGALVGQVGQYASAGSIDNSYATGTVSGTSGVGGLVGRIYTSSIDNSYSAVTVSGGSNTGGLVGFVYHFSYAAINSTLDNSYATGNVTGTDGVGGLVGLSWNSVGVGTLTIDNSYATGLVTATTNIGGLVGIVTGTPVTLSDSFWDSQTVEPAGVDYTDVGDDGDHADVYRLTTAQMKTQSNFTGQGWDFDTVWEMRDGITYPLLKWAGLLPPVVVVLNEPAVIEAVSRSFSSDIFDDSGGNAGSAEDTRGIGKEETHTSRESKEGEEPTDDQKEAQGNSGAGVLHALRAIRHSGWVELVS